MPFPLSQPSSPRSPGPALVPQRPERRHSPLALWHLLSLDAPTVAALWTFFIARASGITLGWTQPAAMFVAVWMIYAADRLLDARLLDAHLLDAGLLDPRPLDARSSPIAPPGIEARHRFHHRHRARFLTLILAASFALVVLLQNIPTTALHLYALLATLLAAWLLLIHARPLPSAATHSLAAAPHSSAAAPHSSAAAPHSSAAAPQQAHRLPKELAVGIFFPAAVFIPTVARAPWLRPALLPAALLFAAVCTLNCLFLYAWEHPSSDPYPDNGPRSTNLPQAHWTTRWAIAHLPHLATLVLAAAGLVALAVPVSIASQNSPHPLLSALPTPLLYLSLWPALACALSAALLLALHRFRRHLSAVHLRAAADLVLLTPLLLLPFVVR